MVIEQLNRVTLHVLTAVSSAHFPPYEAHPAAAPLRAAFCGRPPAPTGAAYLRRARAEGHGGARPLRERRAGIRAVLRRCQSRRRRREAAGAQRAERGHARSGAERSGAKGTRGKNGKIHPEGRVVLRPHGTAISERPLSPPRRLRCCPPPRCPGRCFFSEPQVPAGRCRLRAGAAGRGEPRAGGCGSADNGRRGAAAAGAL